MTSVTVLCHDLARVLGNALAFMPARNRVKHVALCVTPDGVLAAGCRDGYVAGVDTVGTVDFGGNAANPALLLPEEAEVLKKVAQAGKKFPVRVNITGDSLNVETSEEALGVPIVTADREVDMYRSLFALMGDAEKREGALPGALMLDPALMAPFAKVKSDSTDRKADLLIKDERSPILVKIGPTFRGLMMPIHREQNAKKAGEDGLW